MKPTDTRPPFDPRQRFEVDLRDLGPRTAWRRDDHGALTPREERVLTMDVRIDGELEIVGGLIIEASDGLVALDECGMCGLWECNLTDGYAAKVRRIGPYVLWILPNGRVYTFDAADYARALGGAVEEVPTLTDNDAYDLDEPDAEAAYPCRDGAVLAVSGDIGALASLSRCSVVGEGALRAVAPPSEAVEVRAVNGLSASAWIDARPRDDGRRAAYLPAVTRVRVWFAGDAVDRVVEALAWDASVDATGGDRLAASALRPWRPPR